MAADGFDFRPMSEDEREAAAQETALDVEPDAARPAKPPANAEAGAAAAARLFGRQPDAIWHYVDEHGATAFHVCRWNKLHGKVIRPLSWFDDGDWRFGAWPDHRPLLNFAEIAKRTDAPIVVTEGEKAADAVARVFPKSIATTSSGGAQAAKKTYWTPLAGRCVLIWPDNDEAGGKYALEVAAILAALECDVSIIDAAALAAMDPNGGKRTPAKGYDAADALAEWRDVAALRKAAHGLAKPFDPGPAFVSYGPYEMTAGGLHVRDAKTDEPDWISAAFEILGACRDPHGRDWGKYLRWRDGDGRMHMRHVSDAALQGEPAPLCAPLAADGLRINRTRQRALVGYLSGTVVKGRVTIASRTGWLDVGGRSVFVLPDATIGPRGSETVILDGVAHSPYEARGSLKDWRTGVGALASGHVLPVLAISAALAGPLLYLAGGESGGVHFFGQSSKGKTTILQAAASVWGRGASPGYVKAWRATANGLEGAAAAATDTALVLDEMGVLDAREAGPAIYALANGGGKQRSRRDGSLSEPKSWRVSVVSSGEIPLETKLAEGKGKARAGQLLRMLDVPADRGLGFGAFDSGGSEGDAGALARAIKRAASKAYGVAGPEYVRRILTENVAGDDVRALAAGFVRDECPAGADGQVERVAQRLGLFAAAGELGTAFDLTGWREGEARKAAAWALKAWLRNRGGVEPAEVRAVIGQVRLYFEQHGDSRFDPLDKPETKPSPNRAGWRKGEGEEREWLIPPETSRRRFRGANASRKGHDGTGKR